MPNPILATWTTPFELAPFDTISDDDFAPALDEALAAHSAEIDAIANNPEAPDFDNTVGALEAAGEGLDKVLTVFFTLAGADSNPKREELQRAFSPKLSAHFSAITSNKALFARIDAVWQGRADADLTAEQERVLMLTHRSFVRSGAAVEGEAADRLTEVKSRLAELGTQFTQNLLADERGWFMELTEDDLDGLPQFVIDTARAAGAEKGVEGPVITTSRTRCSATSSWNSE